MTAKPTTRRRRGLPAASVVLAALLTATAVTPAQAQGDRLRTPGVQLQAREGASVPTPDVPARTWLLADLDTGDVLAARGAHLTRSPASTIKTLTALTLMPRLDPAAVHIATADDLAVSDGATGMVVGGRYTITDLWHGLLLDSGNDTAMALAHAYDPDVSVTLAAMREQLRLLGATDTVVRNPHGLEADNQVSSVYDMALIARAALQLPLFRTVTTTRTYDFPSPSGSFQIQNENRLVWVEKGSLGGKTGFTSAAGNTYWGAVRRGERRLLVVMFGIQGRTSIAAASLLDWGFRNANRLAPVGQLVSPQDTNEATAPATPPGTPADPIFMAADDAIEPSGAPSSALLLGLPMLAALLALWFSRAARRDRDARSQRSLGSTT